MKKLPFSSSRRVPWVDGKPHIFTVAVPLAYWDPTASMGLYKYVRRVRACSYREALTRCVDDLGRLFQTAPASTQRFSVFVGLAHNPACFASRLSPFVVDRLAHII